MQNILWATLTLLVAIVCCDARGSDDEPVEVLTTHFHIVAMEGVSMANIADVARTLEDNYGRILADFSVIDLPTIDVEVWGRVKAFEATVPRNEDTESAGITGYLVDKGDRHSIRILYASESGAANALHEFAHIVMLAVNPAIANDPKWAWESIALFEAKQFYPPSRLSCVTLSSIPSLGELDADTTHSSLIYRLGYLIGDFLVSEFGADALRRVVASGGDLTKALGMDEISFEREFHRYVTNRYLARDPLPSLLSGEDLRAEVISNTFYFEDGRTMYFAPTRVIYMQSGDILQSGRWFTRAGTNVCWQILNFETFCTSFRKNGDRFWLDTPSDCSRYSLRRVSGNAERF